MSTSRITPADLTVVGRRRPLGTHLREIWEYRELLAGLVRKELKVRYKNSVLGFVWSMVQPVFLLVVYSIVFSILGAGFNRFAIWLLCGLIVWTFISTSFSTAVQSITSNSYLVSKVRFPRAILPLSCVGAAAVHLGLQMLAFAGVLAVSWHPVAWSYLWLLVPAVIAAVLLCAAGALFLATLNVRARDTQHLLDLLLLGWFWLTPIIYQYERAAEWFTDQGMGSALLLLNPATSIIITFQRAIYGKASVDGIALLPDHGQLWYLRNVAIVALVSSILFCFALNYFDRAEANFAEDL
jgi:ABC-2 type transport system permease protein